VDSAHNRDSALKLRLALDDYFPGNPILMVFGASEDKDIYGMFCELLPRMQRIFVTKSVHPRAIDPSKLEMLARRFAKPVKSCATVEEAINDARNAAGRDTIILITGSLFIAAASREVILQNIG
jgi:dihydrofolate synthase/folylpolyglutamate synthase